MVHIVTLSIAYEYFPVWAKAGERGKSKQSVRNKNNLRKLKTIHNSQTRKISADLVRTNYIRLFLSDIWRRSEVD